MLAPYHRSINLNPKIMHLYLHQLLDAITAPGDDSNYGSAAMYDVLCLQALSQRIHYGKFVAEAKFRAQKDKYTLLILDQDAEGIMTALTDKAVEKRVRTSIQCPRGGQFYIALHYQLASVALHFHCSHTLGLCSITAL